MCMRSESVVNVCVCDHPSVGVIDVSVWPI